MQVLPPALAPLGAYRQFIVYRLERRGGKTAKLPLHPGTGELVDAHDPTVWTDFATAAALARDARRVDGVGFVFTAADPFWFLDIDHALVGGRWNAQTVDACNLLAGCAVEVSQSGEGLHLFGTGPVPVHGSDNKLLGMQFYTERRFVALTGTHATGNAAYAPPALPGYVAQHFPPRLVGGTTDAAWWSVDPVPQWRGPTDDNTLLDRAFRSRSATATFGGKASFADLWSAEASVLAATYPPESANSAWNESGADQALAQHLAFWTGNDAERIERLMRRSALRRDKWDDRGDYLPRTIRKACAMQTEWLVDAPPPSAPVPLAMDAAPQGATRQTERTFLAPEDQVAYFAGCVYVADEHKVLTPSGALLDPSRFNAQYGGRTYVMDETNQRIEKKAFTCFTESQVITFPRADTTSFKPLQPPGMIVVENGRTLVNRYVPVQVPRKTGSVKRFLDHLARMYPDERDQRILLGYVAACVQHQGHKFQWAPLIQGMTGNGKGLLGNVVKQAIGKRYCYSPQAANITNHFNAWLEGHVFYLVDEVYVPEERLDLLETLKPLITEAEGLEVIKKGFDGNTRDTCGNFMFLSNHREALRKSRDDRRIAPFFAAQQSLNDLQRDGLTEDYFMSYAEWLKVEGYAQCAQYLHTCDLPAEFDPRRHARAPITSSTAAALSASLGKVEQEVLEAIDLDHLGFRGGFVSSHHLGHLLQRINRSLTPAKQPAMMANIGYTPHPALLGGRVNNPVMPDASRSRLYVAQTRTDLLALTTPAEVAAAYTAAQRDA